MTHPVEADDIGAALDLAATARSLTARDLVHLALCLRHGVDELWTYDPALRTAFVERTG